MIIICLHCLPSLPRLPPLPPTAGTHCCAFTRTWRMLWQCSFFLLLTLLSSGHSNVPVANSAVGPLYDAVVTTCPDQSKKTRVVCDFLGKQMFCLSDTVPLLVTYTFGVCSVLLGFVLCCWLFVVPGPRPAVYQVNFDAHFCFRRMFQVSPILAFK